MSILLAHAADSCETVLALDIERVFVVKHLVRVDKVGAFCVRAIYPRVLRCAELGYGLEERLLSVTVESLLNGVGGDRLSTAARWHARFVGYGLAYHITKAFRAVVVATW
jgi:hypothetical protein